MWSRGSWIDVTPPSFCASFVPMDNLVKAHLLINNRIIGKCTFIFWFYSLCCTGSLTLESWHYIHMPFYAFSFLYAHCTVFTRYDHLGCHITSETTTDTHTYTLRSCGPSVWISIYRHTSTQLSRSKWLLYLEKAALYRIRRFWLHFLFFFAVCENRIVMLCSSSGALDWWQTCIRASCVRGCLPEQSAELHICLSFVCVLSLSLSLLLPLTVNVNDIQLHVNPPWLLITVSINI